MKKKKKQEKKSAVMVWSDNYVRVVVTETGSVVVEVYGGKDALGMARWHRTLSDVHLQRAVDGLAREPLKKQTP